MKTNSDKLEGGLPVNKDGIRETTTVDFTLDINYKVEETVEPKEVNNNEQTRIIS